MNQEHQAYGVIDLAGDAIHNAIRSKEPLLARNASRLALIVIKYEKVLSELEDIMVPMRAAGDRGMLARDALLKTTEARKAAKRIAQGFES